MSVQKIAKMQIRLRQAVEGTMLAVMAGRGAFLFALISADRPDEVLFRTVIVWPITYALVLKLRRKVQGDPNDTIYLVGLVGFVTVLIALLIEIFVTTLDGALRRPGASLNIRRSLSETLERFSVGKTADDMADFV